MRKLLVFDIDETLTDFPWGESIEDTWATHKNFQKIKNLLESLAHRDDIYQVIVTRGVRDDASRFLQTVGLLHLFDVALGSPSVDVTNNVSDKSWGEVKKEFILSTAKVLKIPKKDVFFFDDQMANISAARATGINAWHVDPPGCETTIRLVKRHLKLR